MVGCVHGAGVGIAQHHKLVHVFRLKRRSHAKEDIEMNELYMQHAFYMVYVDGSSQPTVCHTDRASAVRESERLAIKTKKTVYLMKSIEGFKIQESPVERFNLS